MQIAAFLLSIAIPLQAPEQGDVTSFLNKWNSSVEKIWSYDVKLHATVDTFSKRASKLVRVGDHVLRQRFMQGSWRVDQIETNRFYWDRDPERWRASSDEIAAFAYEVPGNVRFFSSRTNFGQFGSLYELHRAKLLALQLYESFRGDFYGQSFFDMLTPRVEQGTTVGKGPFVTLSFAPAGDPVPRVTDPKTLFEITLDGSKGYMPRSIRRSPNPTVDPDFIVETENELVQVRGEVWVPARIRQTTWSPTYTGDRAIPMSVSALELDLEHSTFNADIHPDVFRLPFPPGAVVYDESRRRNFMQAGGGKKDYKAYDEFVRSKFRGGGAPPVFPRLTRVLLAVDAAAVLILGGALWLRRRWRTIRAAARR